jgi:hypothetical protein
LIRTRFIELFPPQEAHIGNRGDCFINLFSVNNPEYPNLFGHDLKDHPVIPNPQLPIAT